MKLLADKKVYEDKGKGENNGNGVSSSGLKKSGSLHMNIKQDMLDLVDTSDNFFIGTGDKVTIWFDFELIYYILLYDMGYCLT